MHDLVEAGTYTEREHQRSCRNYSTGSLSPLRPPTCGWRIQVHKEDSARSDSSWWCVISRLFLSGYNNVKPALGNLCMNSIYASQGRWIRFYWRSWRIGANQIFLVTTRKTVLREVEVFHTELRIFDFYLAISRGRFVWTIVNSNNFDLLL